MKSKILKIVIVALTASPLVFAAPGPIDIGGSTLIKRLKRSIENPIDLYKSVSGDDHNDHLFTVRVISRLEPNGTLAQFSQAAVRNEICAASKIQAANVGNAYSVTPGAFAIQEFQGNIVAVQDAGLMGERLDSVLRKLSSSDNASKVAIAASYAGEMVRVLVAIHAGDVTWNNASLSNFYVQPDGTLTAIDFSTAKNSPGGVDTQDKKDERLSLLANAVLPMYEILFAKTGDANPGDAQAEFIALAGVGNAWRAQDWTDGNFNGAVAAGAAAPTYLPAQDALLAAEVNIARAEHRPAAGVPPADAANMGDATGFALPTQLLPLVLAAVGAPPWTNLTTMCAGW